MLINDTLIFNYINYLKKWYNLEYIKDNKKYILIFNKKTRLIFEKKYILFEFLKNVYKLKKDNEI